MGQQKQILRRWWHAEGDGRQGDAEEVVDDEGDGEKKEGGGEGEVVERTPTDTADRSATENVRILRERYLQRQKLLR